MKYSIYSDKGRVKEINQDNYLLRITRHEGRACGFVAVCDGVSGFACGEVASAFVIHRLDQVFEQFKEGELDLEKAVKQIHQDLYTYARARGENMGTTLSLLAFKNGLYQILQIGDSRIYQYDRYLQQLSKDQTLAREKLDSNVISYQQFIESNEHHILTQCLGITQRLMMYKKQGKIQQGACFLVCSDGLYKRLNVNEISNYMKYFDEDEKDTSIARDMALCAIDLGECDNVTAVLVKIQDEIEHA